MFIEMLQTDPVQYVSWILTVVVSIILHELAHGWMAIRLGDDTPIVTGHMTADPLKHMGLFSIVVLLVVGIAWGQMPINPSRLRHRYGEALVAVAGPAMNLALSLLGLTLLGIWMRFGDQPQGAFLINLQKFLFIFGRMNLLLCLFNLIPLPPLDGSHILANFHRGYAMAISDPGKRQLFFFLFIAMFMFGGSFLFSSSLTVSYHYLVDLLGVPPQRFNQ